MLRGLTEDDALVDALKTDWRTAELELTDTAMLLYADKLTRECASVTEVDLNALRAVGYDDTGILQINLIASFFNYINRVADGLGVGRP